MEDPLLGNGGELGRAMAERDWSRTAVGSPEPGRRPAEHGPDRPDLPLLDVGGLGPGARPPSTTTPTARPAAGQAPGALGRPAAEVWAEIWHDIGPRIQSVLETGVATWDEDLLLFLERSGYPEETYHTFCYSPLRRRRRRAPRACSAWSPRTPRGSLGERRLATLRDLAAARAERHDRARRPDVRRRGAGPNLADVPFSLVYLLDDEAARAWAPPGIARRGRARPATIAADDPDPPGRWPRIARR